MTKVISNASWEASSIHSIVRVAYNRKCSHYLFKQYCQTIATQIGNSICKNIRRTVHG